MNVDTMWGFSIEAELVENKEKQDELCCYVSRVEERSVASSNGRVITEAKFLNRVAYSQLSVQGLMKGDEIMVINGAIVSDLDMMFIESVLQEELTLCMMLRSARTGWWLSYLSIGDILDCTVISQILRQYLRCQAVEMLT